MGKKGERPDTTGGVTETGCVVLFIGEKRIYLLAKRFGYCGSRHVVPTGRALSIKQPLSRVVITSVFVVLKTVRSYTAQYRVLGAV